MELDSNYGAELLEVQKQACFEFSNELIDQVFTTRGKKSWIIHNQKMLGEVYDTSLVFPFHSTIGLDLQQNIVWIAEVPLKNRTSNAMGNFLKLSKNFLNDQSYFNVVNNKTVFEVKPSVASVSYFGNVDNNFWPPRTTGLGLFDLFTLGGMDIKPPAPEKQIPEYDDITTLRIVLEDGLSSIKNSRKKT